MFFKTLPSFILLFFFAAFSVYAADYLPSADSFYSRPTSVISWRMGLSLGTGPSFNNDSLPLVNTHIGALNLVGEVLPNRSFVDMIFLHADLDWRTLSGSGSRNLEIVGIMATPGIYVNGPDIKYLGDLKFFGGPMAGVGIYKFVEDFKSDWYFTSPPQIGLLYGLKTGAELFFSPMLSSFFQLKFFSGNMFGMDDSRLSVSGENGNSTYLENLNSIQKRVTVFEFDVGLRFYYGQNLFLSHMGFFEKN